MFEHRNHFLYGLGSWLVTGILFALWMVLYTSYNRFFPDYLLLIFYITIVFLIAGISTTLLLFLLNTILKFSKKAIGGVSLTPGVISCGFAFAAFIALRILSLTDTINLVSIRAFIYYLISLLVGFGISYLGRLALSRMNQPLPRKAFGFGFIVIILCFVIPFMFKSNTENLELIDSNNIDISTTGLKVAVIGLDAASWEVIDPLIEKNELEYMKKLKNEGTTGVLISEPSDFLPMFATRCMGIISPSIWESVATGKPEVEHGIFDFSSVGIPGADEPLPLYLSFPVRLKNSSLMTSKQHRVKRIWNILDENGRKSVVVRWMTTWPVSPMKNGILISDRFHYGIERSIWPPTLKGTFKPNKSQYPTDVGNYFECVPNIDAVSNIDSLISRDSVLTRYPHTTRKTVEACMKDKYYSQLGCDLISRSNPSFFALYLRGLDDIQHIAWKYFEPEKFSDVEASAVDRFGCLIPGYCRFADDIIEEVLSRIDSNTILILLSDHGQQARPIPYMDFLDELRGKSIDSEITGFHQKEGIIAIYGPHVKKSYRLKDASIFDVAPTILYILGFPVARDMAGKPLLDAFDESLVQSNPVSYIETYGASDTESSEEVVSTVDEQIKENLKALGYIN